MIRNRRLKAAVGLRLVVGFARILFLAQPAWGPVGVRGVAAARAMERGDVLEGDQDVAVQLDVRDVLQVAVGREDAVLVLAAEEGDLHLLALVLVRVVLHERNASRWGRPGRPGFGVSGRPTGRPGSGARGRCSSAPGAPARR